MSLYQKIVSKTLAIFLKASDSLTCKLRESRYCKTMGAMSGCARRGVTRIVINLRNNAESSDLGGVSRRMMEPRLAYEGAWTI